MLAAVCLVLTFFGLAPIAWAGSTHRLHDGITAFVNNAEGRDFTIHLGVRDINLYETGPREVLVKVYDPDGRVLVRQVLPDDGVKSKAFLPPLGAWDHEAWYYTYCYMKGTQPMIRWSAFSEPDRLNTIPKRDFTWKIKATKKGVYRVLVVGAIDHYVTLKLNPNLPYALAGHPDWLHGHGEQWRRSFVYVPQGTKAFHVIFAEYDLPRRRHLTVRGPDGQVLHQGGAPGGFSKALVQLDQPGQLDGQLLTVEVSQAPGDFLVGIKFVLKADPEVHLRGLPKPGAFEQAQIGAFAPDPETARAVRGGAIHHDGRVFWHGFQVRLHDWLKKIPPEGFEVKTADGKPADPAPTGKPNPKDQLVPLPTRPGYVVLNGPYWTPPLCDRIMHHYPAHKNRAALNLAIRDLAAGLREIGPNDHPAHVIGGPFINLAYEFGNYGWHLWRPAWRLLQESDAPNDVKEIIREAFLVCGDRLAFCRSWERINGNAYAQLVSALRYCCEATGDKLQRELFDTYWERFTSGGWGERVGVGPSGPVQEGFAYSHHYGSYILTTWQSILTDLKDERFQKVYDRIRLLYSYTLADENTPTGPWSARTHYYPHWQPEMAGPFIWKGLPGPDFTVSVNDGNEFFAARRKNYYVLTYHGRLSPKWESNAQPGNSGYGGGMICQLQIPGRGLVLASTLNGSYGEGMDTSLWRTFHLHTLVGEEANGRPLVTGDSEHFDARLNGITVTSSGHVRDSSVRVLRSFTFHPQHITCTVQLRETEYTELLTLWLKNDLRGKVKEAYEMIPYQPMQKGKKLATAITALDAAGKTLGPVGKEALSAKRVVIDRGGFGVRIELERERPVLRGQNHTVLIRLVDRVTPAGQVELTYRLVPWVAGEESPPGSQSKMRNQGHPL